MMNTIVLTSFMTRNPGAQTVQRPSIPARHSRVRSLVAKFNPIKYLAMPRRQTCS